MTTLFVFCGSPGSGKTTLSKQMAEQNHAERISFDELKCIRYSEMMSPIVAALTECKNVVVDSVFDYVEYRKEILDAVANIPCRKILVHMNTPLDECLRRNANREKPLPDFVVESIYEEFENPALNEGWDEIILPYEKG